MTGAPVRTLPHDPNTRKTLCKKESYTIPKEQPHIISIYIAALTLHVCPTICSADHRPPHACTRAQPQLQGVGLPRTALPLFVHISHTAPRRPQLRRQGPSPHSPNRVHGRSTHDVSRCGNILTVSADPHSVHAHSGTCPARRHCHRRQVREAWFAPTVAPRHIAVTLPIITRTAAPRARAPAPFVLVQPLCPRMADTPTDFRARPPCTCDQSRCS